MFMNFVVTLADKIVTLSDKVDTLAESVKSLQAQTEKNSLLFAKLVKRSQFDYDFLNLTGEKVAEAYMKALEHQPYLFLESCRSTTMTESKKLAEVVKLLGDKYLKEAGYEEGLDEAAQANYRVQHWMREVRDSLASKANTSRKHLRTHSKPFLLRAIKDQFVQSNRIPKTSDKTTLAATVLASMQIPTTMRWVVSFIETKTNELLKNRRRRPFQSRLHLLLREWLPSRTQTSKPRSFQQVPFPPTSK